MKSKLCFASLLSGSIRKFVLSNIALGALTLATGSASAAVLAHYSFDSNYNDSSGNSNHGTLTDAGTLLNSGITTTAGEYKFGGGAMNFGGGGDKIVPTTTIDLTAAATGDWSVAFWAKNRTVANNSGGMIVGDTSDTRDFIWVDSANTGLRFRNTGNANANFALTPNEDTLWHHYVVIASDTDSDSSVDDITLYRDGSLIGTVNNIAGDLTINAIGNGYNTAGFSFDGQIDELYILDSALTSTEITSLYTSNTIPEPGVALLGSLGLLALLRRRR